MVDLLQNTNIHLSDVELNFLNSGIVTKYKLEESLYTQAELKDSGTLLTDSNLIDIIYNKKIDKTNAEIELIENNINTTYLKKEIVEEKLELLCNSVNNLAQSEMNAFRKSKSALQSEIEAFDESLSGLKGNRDEYKNWRYIYAISKQYPMIDLSFLNDVFKEMDVRIRKDSREYFVSQLNVPVFATYNYFQEANFELTVPVNRKNAMLKEKNISEVIFNKYFGIYGWNTKNISHLESIRNKVYSANDYIFFTSSFESFIPRQTKLKIAEAQKTFNNNIYIIAEANYVVSNIDVEPIAFSKCPLVIGTTDRSAHFITSFDKTLLEEYIESISVDGKGGKN